MRTLFGSEESVVRSLRGDLGLEALVPLHRTEWPDALGRTRTRLVPLYPTYALLRCAFDDHLWHDVTNVTGVTGILGGARPKAIPDPQVEVVRSRMDASGVVRDLDTISADLEMTLRIMKWGYGVNEEVRLRAPAALHLRGVTATTRAIEPFGTKVEYWMLGFPHETIVPHAACEPV